VGVTCMHTQCLAVIVADAVSVVVSLCYHVRSFLDHVTYPQPRAVIRDHYILEHSESDTCGGIN